MKAFPRSRPTLRRAIFVAIAGVTILLFLLDSSESLSFGVAVAVRLLFWPMLLALSAWFPSLRRDDPMLGFVAALLLAALWLGSILGLLMPRG